MTAQYSHLSDVYLQNAVNNAQLGADPAVSLDSADVRN